MYFLYFLLFIPLFITIDKNIMFSIEKLFHAKEVLKNVAVETDILMQATYFAIMKYI